ncbi:MAG: 2-hydroxyacid dehydrogenase [Flavobacteriaceae bacterium]
MTKRDIGILIAGKMMDMVEDQVRAGFNAWQAGTDGSLDELVARHGGDIRGIATGGHFKVDAALIDRLPNLQIVSNFGVGYDTVDAAHAGSRGIYVTNTPDVLTEEVADTTLGLILMTVRELPQTERYLRAGKWLDRPYPLTRATLRDRKVGILGLGRIGKAVARRLEAFGTPIAYHGRSRQADVDYEYHATLKGLAEAVDILVSIAPGGADTHHLIGAEVLNALGPDGIVINIGRGSVVDEEALIAALREKRILSAGLDVFEHEPKVPQALIEMDQVVLLPHVGSASVHTRGLMGQLVVDNLTSWFDEGRPLTPVAETPFGK